MKINRLMTGAGGDNGRLGRGNAWQHLVIMSIIRSVCQRAQLLHMSKGRLCVGAL